MSMQVKKSTLDLVLRSLPLFIIIIFIGGVFSPNMEARGALMSLNLDEALAYQGGSSVWKQ